MTDLEKAARAVLAAWDDDDEGCLAEAIYSLGLSVAKCRDRARPNDRPEGQLSGSLGSGEPIGGSTWRRPDDDGQENKSA